MRETSVRRSTAISESDASQSVQSRDEFLRLWEAHSRALYARALTLIPNRADADDLLQEVATTAWTKFDDFETGTSFRAWATRILVNKVMNHRSRLRSRGMHLSQDFVDAVAAEIEQRSAALDQQSRRLADCFARLSQGDQSLILSHYEQGAAVKAIAEQAGKSASAIYKSLNRIHQVLFACITREA